MLPNAMLWVLLLAVATIVPAQNSTETSVELRIIVVDSSSQAASVLPRLKNGKDFAAIAKAISIDPISFAFISGPLHLKSADARKQAFLSSMGEIGLESDPALLVEGTHTVEGGIAAFGKLMAGPTRPSAVFCSNDMTTLGVMRKAYEEGIRIPSDLSVIGFDDIRLAQFVLPALTTAQMSQADLARLAFNALLAELQRETPSPTGTEYNLRTHLVLPESTRLVSSYPKSAAMKT